MEKEVYAVQLLSLLSGFHAAVFTPVFAGGTSLAKAPRNLSRMSEAIDIKRAAREEVTEAMSRTALKTARKAALAVWSREVVDHYHSITSSTISDNSPKRKGKTTMRRWFSTTLPIVLTVVTGFWLSGCSDSKDDATTKAAPSVRPVAMQTISNTALGSMSFNGVVRSAERAELAFRVPGKLAEMNVDEGDKVETGQVLAKLEQEEFLTAVDSAKVRFDKDQADYRRGAQIFKSSQAISRSDLEKLKTTRDLAKNKLSNARQDLDDASLRAPFDGVIAEKTVNNFRNVNSGQTVYVLHDLSELEVVVDVPGKLFLKPSDQQKAFAMVENNSDVRLPVVYKKFSSDADSLSQTYRVTLELTDLKGQNVLPGMNVRVYPVDAGGKETVVQIPLQAVSPTNTGDEFVWLVGDDGEVKKRVVQVGQLLDDQVIVQEGLAVGDRIAVAGVGALKEGMKVRPLQEKGQP